MEQIGQIISLCDVRASNRRPRKERCSRKLDPEKSRCLTCSIIIMYLYIGWLLNVFCSLHQKSLNTHKIFSDINRYLTNKSDRFIDWKKEGNFLDAVLDLNWICRHFGASRLCRTWSKRVKSRTVWGDLNGRVSGTVGIKRLSPPTQIGFPAGGKRRYNFYMSVQREGKSLFGAMRRAN